MLMVYFTSKFHIYLLRFVFCFCLIGVLKFFLHLFDNVLMDWEHVYVYSLTLYFLCSSFKLFINPSTTDVVCTTTAEALAMGKIVVCADHCSNEFFKQFPNCWTYNNHKEFVELTLKALTEEPGQPTDAQRHDLSWEAATERFLKAVDLDKQSERKLLSRTTSYYLSTSLYLQQTVEDASAFVHHVASGFEISRRIFGAIPHSLQPDEQLRKELGFANTSGT